MSGEPLLDVRDLSKRYGSNVVLNDVSLCVASGEAVSVIGENGAGKSTLAKIIAGVIEPDTGSIYLDASTVRFRSPRDALQHGIGFIPQELAYFPDLSVAENILVGVWPSRGGVVSHANLRTRAFEAAERLGIEVQIGRQMSELKLGERQLVEIIKALSRSVRLIVLDEPTASLTSDESEKLFRVLRNLVADGVGVIYISHRMDEVFRFSDRVDVLRNGSLVASAAPADTTPGQLIRYMLGSAAEERSRHQSAARTSETPVLSVVNWSSRGDSALRGMTLQVMPGEIVGVFGIRGCGSELLAEGLAGLRSDVDGEIMIDGRRGRIFRNPRSARVAGVAYVPAERKREGLVLTLPIQANLSLLVLRQLSFVGFLRARLENQMARNVINRFNIRCQSLRQKVSELSGGNQQKTMVASRLATQPRVCVLQEPTRGVDVGARIEIHRFLRQLAAEGIGILFVTSDVEEAVAVSDRLLVMREGRLVGNLSGQDKTQSRALAIAAKETR